MKTFLIPIVWQLAGTMRVQADTLEDAERKALDKEPLPDGDYIADSTELDHEHTDYGQIEEAGLLASSPAASEDEQATGEEAEGYDVVGSITAYEQGELGSDEIIELFQHLVDNGTINGLQGSYQRTAARLIGAGYINAPQA